MVYSFFMIGLGFLLTLKPESVAQRELTAFSLMAEVQRMLPYLVTTGVHLLLFVLVGYLVVYWWSFQQKARLR